MDADLHNYGQNMIKESYGSLARFLDAYGCDTKRLLSVKNRCVSVRFYQDNGQLSNKCYSYYTSESLSVGDLVLVNVAGREKVVKVFRTQGDESLATKSIKAKVVSK